MMAKPTKGSAMLSRLFRKPERPKTVVGQWLYAGALRQGDEVRKPLVAELDRTCWVDAETVVEAACELVVRDAYGPNATAMEVPDLVAGIRAFFSSDGVERFSQDHGERLVRRARGEDVRVDDIAPKDAMIVHSLIFSALANDLKYTKAEATELVLKAEQIAISRGHRPTLAYGA